MSGKYKFVLLFICIMSIHVFSANTITRTVSGVVVDAHTKKPLSLANVSLQKSGFGQSSDRNGRFKFKGHISSRDTLSVKYMGYESYTVPVSFGKQDTLFIKVSLQPLVLPMPEVSVAASRFNLERQLMALDPSAMHFTPADLEKLPSVAFADLYRALQKKPGFTTTNEASPQLHIRGGNMDQNLILLDGAPIYYPYHFLGISSSFNMDALDEINVSLGGFSTYFGNRLSSVLALSTKQPQEKFKAKLNFNIIGTDVTSYGKIGSKISWLGSFRASYFDIVEAMGVDEIPYHYQDGLGKIQFHPSEEHHIQLTFFGNHDELDDNKKSKHYLYSTTDTTLLAYTRINRTNMDWENTMTSLQWDFQPKEDIGFHFTAFKSHYGNLFFKEKLVEFPSDLHQKYHEAQQEVILTLNEENEFLQSHITNNFRDQGLKLSGEWRHNNILWIAGVEESWYKADYGWDQMYKEMEDDYIRLFFDYAPENNYKYNRYFHHKAGFVEGKWDVRDNLSLRPGLRMTQWSFLSEFIAEPRLNIHYKQENWHTSFSVGRFSQGISTALEEGLIGFLELYFPVENQNSIETATHYILDFVRDFSPKTQLAIAVYYKDFASLLKSMNANPQFVTSSGDAKGLEVSCKTALKGWDVEGSYTLAHSRRHYAGLNYDTNFDYRHRMQLSLHRTLPGDLDVSAYWEFHSGQPYCPGAYHSFIPFTHGPMDRHYDEIWYSAYEMDVSRDKIRYPYYHRLDIQFSRTVRFKHAVLSPYLSVYNAYWHKNVLYYRTSNFTYDHKNGRWQNPHLERDPFTLPLIPTVGMKIEF